MRNGSWMSCAMVASLAALAAASCDVGSSHDPTGGGGGGTTTTGVGGG